MAVDAAPEGWLGFDEVEDGLEDVVFVVLFEGALADAARVPVFFAAVVFFAAEDFVAAFAVLVRFRAGVFFTGGLAVSSAAVSSAAPVSSLIGLLFCQLFGKDYTVDVVSGCDASSPIPTKVGAPAPFRLP